MHHSYKTAQYVSQGAIVNAGITIGSECWHFDLESDKSSFSKAVLSMVQIPSVWAVHLNIIGAVFLLEESDFILLRLWGGDVKPGTGPRQGKYS